MKPRAACPAGRADAAQSTPFVRARSSVCDVHWRPSLCRMDT
jgi:hypothetical protein